MFDSVLVVSFGGPNGLADIRPFLERVLRGRRVSPERIDEVAHHYEMFGGVSPITELTMRQAEGLRQRLTAAGRSLPVYVGMRNWHPLLEDTLQEMWRGGARHAVGFITAAHHSYSSCQQYRENVAGARAALRAQTGGDIDVTYVPSWFDHPLFVEANASHVRAAVERLPVDVRGGAQLIFTAHSIPLSMAESSLYREQLLVSARLVASSAGVAAGCLSWTRASTAASSSCGGSPRRTRAATSSAGSRPPSCTRLRRASSMAPSSAPASWRRSASSDRDAES